jgi:hypothetical protein
MNGLGTVTPQVADGAAAPSGALSESDEAANMEITVVLDDGTDAPAQADVAFAGLAPGFAGLYQVNFTIPSSGLQNGEVYIAFNTNEALNFMSTISLAGFIQTPDQSVPSRRASLRDSMLRMRAAASKAAYRGHSKKRSRALPERK